MRRRAPSEKSLKLLLVSTSAESLWRFSFCLFFSCRDSKLLLLLQQVQDHHHVEPWSSKLPMISWAGHPGQYKELIHFEGSGGRRRRRRRRRIRKRVLFFFFFLLVQYCSKIMGVVSEALVQDGQGLSAVLDQLVQLWLMVRAPIVAPLLQLAVNLCLVMVTMLFVERIFMCGVLVVVKLLGRTPKTTYKFEPMKDTDLELGNSAYPMVLVQIPMYNEKEVLYKTTHFFPQLRLLPAELFSLLLHN